jgi:hypothetical protein
MHNIVSDQEAAIKDNDIDNGGVDSIETDDEIELQAPPKVTSCTV